jgi:ACS family tartrate transporter-like MFS transporter
LTDVGPRAIRRLRRRLIPFLAAMYFVAYFDRLNVGFAALQMNAALGLTALQYGRGAGIFFLGYFLFEVPSNIILEKTGARIWIARIMITWGIAAAVMAFVVGPISFLTLRFLLGVAEAGFFPGMILYFTYWFPSKYRARVIAALFLAVPGANAVTAVVSGALYRLTPTPSARLSSCAGCTAA